MKLTKVISAFAVALALATVGCAAPQMGTVSTVAPRGAIGFFDQVNGLSSVTIRVVDKRLCHAPLIIDPLTSVKLTPWVLGPFGYFAFPANRLSVSA